jgi:hypothetical protein
MTATTNAAKTASAATTARNAEREPMKIERRIGSTDYIINVRFSQSARETVEEKILKLIESEVLHSA